MGPSKSRLSLLSTMAASNLKVMMGLVIRQQVLEVLWSLRQPPCRALVVFL